MKNKCCGRLCVALCLSLVICTLASCGGQAYREINVRGIDRFGTDQTYDKMCRYLIPEGFADAYPTVGSEFVYTDHGDRTNKDVSAILWFRYADEETYRAAKEYYLSHMKLAGSDYVTLGDITFREIEGYSASWFGAGARRRFPYRYTMFAWSDEARVLIAFGVHEDPIGVGPERWQV